jgi:hypothetical protein
MLIKRQFYVLSGSKVTRIYCPKNKVNGKLYVIKGISHGLRFDIFIQLVVCFLFPLEGSGIEKHNSVDKNHIKPQYMGDSLYKTPNGSRIIP